MPGMYYSGLGCFMVSLTLYSKCFNFFVFDFTILCIFPDERSRLVSIKKYGKLRFIRVLGKFRVPKWVCFNRPRSVNRVFGTFGSVKGLFFYQKVCLMGIYH